MHGGSDYLLFWEIALDPLSINYFYIEYLNEAKCNSHENLKNNPCVENANYEDLSKGHT